uniref:Gst19 n=1 Tax=Arundo donax TaxID=35708 RepID=A0A0A9CR47_ARUDO
MRRDSLTGRPWWRSTGIFLWIGLERRRRSLLAPRSSCSKYS